MKLQEISRNFKILVISNILIVVFIYADLILPSGNIQAEKFSKIEEYVRRVSSGKSGGSSSLQQQNFLFCKSQNIYEVYAVSDCLREISENQKIYIVESAVLSKVKSINVAGKTNCKSISFLENKYVLSFFCIALLICFLFLFFSNPALDFLLAFATVYIYFSALTYLFCWD